MQAPLLKQDIETGRGDVVIGANGDLQCAHWLETAIFTSLFTDAAVVQPIDGYRGGCWDDALLGYSHGSKLWTLRREKITPQLLVRIENIASAALKWLLDESHVAELSVAASRDGRDRVALLINVTLNDGEQECFTYAF
jgi:phage gp46-like protein